MNILLEIIKEIFFYLQAALYTLLGLFIKIPDSPEGDKNPVILIPGLMGNPLVLSKLRRSLITKGYPVYIPDLSYQISAYEHSARKLEQFILERNLRDVYIIGHSAGGIIVTQMGYKGRDRIKKFFATSSPFHGTWLALFIFFLPAGRQLIPGSAFLKNNEINFMTFPNLQCLYTRFDLLIIPGFEGRLGRIDDTEFPGIGHLNIIMSSSGVKFITERLGFEDSKEEHKKPKQKEPAKPEKLRSQKPGKAKPVKEAGKPAARTKAAAKTSAGKKTAPSKSVSAKSPAGKKQVSAKPVKTKKPAASKRPKK